MKQEILEYMRTNEINKDLIFRDSALSQMRFVRDEVCRYLLNKTPCYVVSTHYSKSIQLPVYEFDFNGITVTMRENFYGWVVSLNSTKPITFDKDLIYYDIKEDIEGIYPCYCEGFDEKWVYPAYLEGCHQCTFRVFDKYRLWTLIYLLNKI